MQIDTERGRHDPIYFSEVMLGMPLHKGQSKYLLEARKGIVEIVEEHNKEVDRQFKQMLKKIQRAINDPEKWVLIRRYILTCANRWGKTAVIAILQLWYLFYKFGIRARSAEEWFDIEYRTANIAPFSSLTEPVFLAMKAIMTSSYPIRDQKTGMMSTNKCKIEAFYLEEKTINNPPYKLYFANNSYIEHLSLMGGKGDNLQGKPYGLITYDEAPRSDHLHLELDNSILGRLLDWTAALHMIGTSDIDSKSLLYWAKIAEEASFGINSSYRQEGAIYENTFMTKEQIAEHEKMLEGNPLKDTMLMGKIILGTQTIFPGQDILDAQDETLNDGVRYEEGHKYVIGVDTAIGSDEMVYLVLDVTSKPYKLVWMEAVKGSSRSPQMHLNVLCNLVDSYRNGSNLQLALETFNGESARFYQDLPPYIQTFTRTYGSWQPNRATVHSDNPAPKKTNQVKKADLIIALKKILAAKEIKIPKNGYDLVEQLGVYREDDKGLPTDRVMALALAVWLAEDNSRVDKPAFVAIEW